MCKQDSDVLDRNFWDGHHVEIEAKRDLAPGNESRHKMVGAPCTPLSTGCVWATGYHEA